MPPPSHAFVTPGPARLAEIAVPAAAEAWAQARLADRAPRALGIYLGQDEADDGRAVIEALTRHFRTSFTVERVDSLGRAAGLAALHRAARHIREGRVDVALVGGVDSWVRADAIERLVESGKLRDDDHPQGIIPGEAAAFAVLEGAPPSGVRPLAWLTGSGVAQEPSANTEDASEGVGITQALRKAISESGAQEFPRVVCDLNGDRYRAMEWAYGLVRALGGLTPVDGGPASNEAWHPADCIGDCGAASGIVNLAWAVTAMRRGHARSSLSLVWGGSDGVLRAAAMLARDASGA
jgi:3-oxoacyl-[acyl-carrier-protein] synthase-1